MKFLYFYGGVFMNNFAEKVRNARTLLNLTQAELGELIGVSSRAVIAYETGASVPHKSRLKKLADTLGVSAEYLTNDDITNPTYGMEKENLVSATQERFGKKAAGEISFLMERSAALFAGGSISQEQKDAFFNALAKAYWTAKDEAKNIYGKKS